MICLFCKLIGPDSFPYSVWTSGTESDDRKMNRGGGGGGGEEQHEAKGLFVFLFFFTCLDVIAAFAAIRLFMPRCYLLMCL